MKIDIGFILKVSILYGTVAVSFSTIGVLFPEHELLGTPLGSLDLSHIAGHAIWGMMAGIASLSLRYILLAGSFAVILDSDHLIQLLEIEGFARMAHSLPFGIISALILMLTFRKRGFLLGAVSFSAMLVHISFDILGGSLDFPLFTPFYNSLLRFHNADWVLFQVAAVMIIALAMMHGKGMIPRISIPIRFFGLRRESN